LTEAHCVLLLLDVFVGTSSGSKRLHIADPSSRSNLVQCRYQSWVFHFLSYCHIPTCKIFAFLWDVSICDDCHGRPNTVCHNKDIKLLCSHADWGKHAIEHHCVCLRVCARLRVAEDEKVGEW